MFTLPWWVWALAAGGLVGVAAVLYLGVTLLALRVEERQWPATRPPGPPGAP